MLGRALACGGARWGRRQGLRLLLSPQNPCPSSPAPPLFSCEHLQLIQMTFAVPWLLPTAAELLSLVRHFTATLRTAFQLGTGAPSTVKRSMYALGTADRQPGLRSENVTHLSKNEAEVHVGPQGKTYISSAESDLETTAVYFRS